MKKKATRACRKQEPIVREESERKRIIAKRKGVCIRIRGWTEETGSGSEAHAKSITAAIRELRIAAKYHANFSVDVFCEGPRPEEPFCCEWFHQRHIAYIANRGLDSQPCLHDGCLECVGTGVKKDGSPCVHHLSCPCPKCTPRC